MHTQDPNNKKIVNGTDEHSYDSDDKLTNTNSPVREGQDNSSILSDESSVGEDQLEKIKNYETNPHQMEEWVDTDKVNFKPED